MSQQQYKQLQRQLRRLPLPQKIIKHGSTVLKHRFKLGKTKNFETIFTQLLDHEQYHKYIPNLLDAIYKDSKPKWYRDFNNIPYIRVKEHWPTVHIMDEIANSKTKKIYHEKLSSDFKVSDYVKGNDKSRNAFPLIRKYGEQVKSIPKLIEEVEKAYTFIVHSPRIGLTKHPFDVRHLPSKLGIPQHPVGLDMKLKETVSI
ncbi:uncharacterized protein KGF55_002168 [Candida pseudojiufengensis]|uniref:uncharacterized protein n=1 Tax=Candida pseudojiufengensis TaxID=497109 RepID=UPI0022245E4A|nr:uncharacterized protein KGF55_002168 [Candida pseudojiufengensis]KAI5964226.1 hypothetical protein KGF55_002168 [Candida pseudojiufengensis]